MQLIKMMFGRVPVAGPGSESAQFHESETSGAAASRNAPRRELIHVVLRDSMRRHGIPSDWIECRVLSGVTRHEKTGMHVQLIVRDGVDRLLTYVPAFQRSLMEEITRFDPRVGDWLLSLSWQFQTVSAHAAASMPDPAAWAASVPAQLPTAEPALAAGLTVRQADNPFAAPAGPLAATEPARPAPLAQPSRSAADLAGDAEVLEDLQALYAIRDAAIHQGRPNAAAAAGRDFESTHPGADDAPAADLRGPRGW